MKGTITEYLPPLPPSPMRVFTSARVISNGSHDEVSLWNRGASCGSLVLKAGDGEQLARMLGLRAEHPPAPAVDNGPISVPMCGCDPCLRDADPRGSYCLPCGTVPEGDDNGCAACLRVAREPAQAPPGDEEALPYGLTLLPVRQRPATREWVHRVQRVDALGNHSAWYRTDVGFIIQRETVAGGEAQTIFECWLSQKGVETLIDTERSVQAAIARCEAGTGWVELEGTPGVYRHPSGAIVTYEHEYGFVWWESELAAGKVCPTPQPTMQEAKRMALEQRRDLGMPT